MPRSLSQDQFGCPVLDGAAKSAAHHVFILRHRSLSRDVDAEILGRFETVLANLEQ